MDVYNKNKETESITQQQPDKKPGSEFAENRVRKAEKLGKEAIAELQKEWFDICTVIYERRDYGAEDGIIQEQAGKLHRWVNMLWDCPVDAFRGLGRTYNTSPDFRKNISEQFGPEMPAFLEQVINSYCNSVCD